MKNNILVDLNNIAWISRFARLPKKVSRKQKDPYAVQVIFKEVLDTILGISQKNKGTGIVIARDERDTWRKQLFEQYKEKLEEEDVYKEEVYQAIELIINFFNEHTAAHTYIIDNTEADDIIAVWCQESNNVNNTIVSTDKDFIQLINENNFLYSPVQRVFRESEDPDFDLFVKCIRGDNSDNIKSAYPRVQTKKLKEAWDDPYKMVNLKQTILKDGSKVEDNFNFNSQLIDLTQQPDYIRDRVKSSIQEKYNNPQGQFKLSKALKYLKDLGFQDINEIFDYKEGFLKNPPVFDNK